MLIARVRRALPGTASDYANMIRAALSLANVTGAPSYITKARDWARVLDRHYWSEEFGGYYLAADDTADLIVRPLNAHDEATPNANGVMISNLAALYLWTGERELRHARRTDRQDILERGGPKHLCA